MKYIKEYKTNDQVKNEITDAYLLCVNNKHWKFKNITVGRRYDLYKNIIGIFQDQPNQIAYLVKDDNDKLHTIWKNPLNKMEWGIVDSKNREFTFFTTDENLKAYQTRKATERFDL